MITYFPEIYDDELFFSYLARLYERSGFLRYRDVAEDLYVVPTCRPPFEFLTAIKPELLDALDARRLSLDTIISYHTMFPFYARFMSAERKIHAYQVFSNATGNLYDTLSIPRNRTEAGRYARYCPLCVKEDRDRYGETYWHRKHQMPYVKVCPIHGCRLVDSTYKSSTRTSPGLTTAEEVIDDVPILPATEIDFSVAKYIDSVMWKPLNLYNDRKIGLYLNSVLQGTKYLSQRGERRDNELLLKDYLTVLGDCSFNMLTEKWQLVKLLLGQQQSIINVLLFGFFMKVSPENLANVPEFSFTQTAEYDANIVKMAKSGISVEKIAAEICCQRKTVFEILDANDVKSCFARESWSVMTDKQKRIRKARWYWIKTIRENPGHSVTALIHMGHKELGYLRRVDREWTKQHMPKVDYHRAKADAETDEQYCRQIPEIVKDFHKGKPVRVCKKAVGRKLGITGAWEKYPLAEGMMTAVQESWEEYWARKVKWTISEILNTDRNVNIGTIEKTSSMKKSQIVAALSYMDEECKKVVEIALMR